MVVGILNLAVLFLSILGWGVLAARIVGQGESVKQNGSFFIWGLCGISLLYVVGTAIHFFLPISDIVGISIIGAGVSVFFIHTIKEEIWQEWTIATVLMGLVTAILLVGYAIDNDFYDDVTMYHMLSVSWIKSDRTIFGLANMNEYMGFNSGWHLISAIGTWGYSQAHYFEWPSVAACLLLSSYLISRIFRPQNIYERLFLSILSIICFGVWAKAYFLRGLGTPGNDTTAAIISLAFLAVFFSFVFRKPTDKTAALEFGQMFLLFNLAVIVKLSQVILLPFLIFATVVFFKRGMNIRKIMPVISLGAVAMICHCFRSFILSGCWVFPATFTCVKTEWSLPLRLVEVMKNGVIAWARLPGPDYPSAMTSNAWLVTWSQNVLHKPEVICAIVLSLIVFLFPPKAEKQVSRLLIGLCYLGISIWFFMAPDIRFGMAIWIYFISVSLCFNFVRFRIGKNIMLPISLVVLVLIFQDYARIALENFHLNPWQGTRVRQMYYPPPHIEKENEVGIRYYIPDHSDQDRPLPGCWWGPTPCALFDRTELGQTITWSGNKMYYYRYQR